MVELTGWTRTALLATGGFLGVMLTAYLIHLYKGETGATAYRRR